MASLFGERKSGMYLWVLAFCGLPQWLVSISADSKYWSDWHMTSTTLGEIDPRVWKDFGFECIYPFTLSLKTLCQAVCIHLFLWHQRPDPDASNLCSCRGGRNCSHERMLGVMCLMEKNQEQKETVTLERRHTHRDITNKRKDEKYILSP